MIVRRKIPVLLAVSSAAALLLICLYLALSPYRVTAFRFSKLGVTVTQQRFLTQDVNLTISCPKDAVVYYTTDGAAPDENSMRYTAPIPLTAADGDFPNCLLLKAVAYYADGTCSDVVTHTFFSHVNMDDWTQNLIMSISGEPSELTDAPDGILYGANALLRGETTEREVYVEAISPTGRTVFEQAAGARVYGGFSRNSSLKSLKLYARREYAPQGGMFKIDVFGTVGADGSVIDQYDKLVLRNHGNDLGWGGFVLDDLNQQLAAQAGHDDTKSTVPAVYYLNGVYQGFYWLQENVCEEYLQDKFGGKNGRYAILEGTETQKSGNQNDPLAQTAANEYRELYNQFAYTDLTDDNNYKNLGQVIDIENYLEYYAYNIYISNWDWPHNNYKCYRYYAEDGGQYEKGNLDGRWRFLYHDMDVSFGAYEHADSVVSYNNLQAILDPTNVRYAPLLANLLRRTDCKTYFVNEMVRLMEGALSAENVKATLDSIEEGRGKDLVRFLSYITKLKPGKLTWTEIYQIRMEQYVAFAQQRPAYMKQFLIEELDLPADYFGS